MTEINIAPLPLDRETIINEGQIPAKLLDRVERLIEKIPNLKSRSYWTAVGGEACCELNIGTKSFYLGLNGFYKQLRVVDYGDKNGFLNPVYKGPLTIASADKAYKSVCQSV